MNSRIIKSRKLYVDDIPVEFQRKKIKNINIRIRHSGEVLVTAPAWRPESEVIAFVRSKADWIRKCVEKAREREKREAVGISCETGDILYLWGEPVRLKVTEMEGAKRGKVVLLTESGKDVICLVTPAGYTLEKRKSLIKAWYKKVLEKRAAPILEKWEKETGLYFDTWHTREMKSRWGSCLVEKRRICLNTKLAEKPLICLDYVALHEIAHIKEPNHGPGFKAILTKYMPEWKEAERILKS